MAVMRWTLEGLTLGALNFGDIVFMGNSEDAGSKTWGPETHSGQGVGWGRRCVCVTGAHARVSMGKEHLEEFHLYSGWVASLGCPARLQPFVSLMSEFLT